MRRYIIYTILLCTITLTTYGQKYGDYIPGCIYDLQNVKSIGLIKWTPPTISPFTTVGDHVFFKLTPDDQRQKVKTAQFSSFVMKADSFVVSHAKETEQYPILKVVFDKAVKLYARYRTTNFNGPAGVYMANRYDIDYYYGPDPDHITNLDRKNFAEVVSSLLDDRPDLAEKIKNKEYKYGDLDDLLKLYFKQKDLLSKKSTDTQKP